MTGLPDFLIVGAPNSGTTALYHYLRTHPDIFMPEEKEPAFLSRLGVMTDPKAYESLFARRRGERAAGEASTIYLYDEATPDRIRALLGADTRILISLRNPVDVAQGLWLDARRYGMETMDFEPALAAETRRMDDPDFGPGDDRALSDWGWRAAFAYRARARYAGQVKRYLDAFGPARCRVLIYEDFFADIDVRIADVYDFLGVDPAFRPEMAVHNAAWEPRSAVMQRKLRQRSRWRAALGRYVPREFRTRLRKGIEGLNRKTVERPALPPELRSVLWRSFEDDVSDLAALLDRPLVPLWTPDESGSSRRRDDGAS